MVQVIYDGSFAGFLTAIFESYDRKLKEVSLVRAGLLEGLVFSDNLEISADDSKALRVWKGLQKRVSDKTLEAIYWAFLSEVKGVEDTIYGLITYVFSTSANVETNFGHAGVLGVTQMARKVGREKHRFEAFVRFELIGDNFFYAPIDPDYNVLPIIAPHFIRRYPTQDWIIYDTKRRYGIHYQRQTGQLNEALIDFSEMTEERAGWVCEPEEKYYKDLWRNYFKSVNIPIRKNTKLHLKHVPKRYWKYLVEKQPG